MPDTRPTHTTVEDAVEIIATATALGMKIPAPEGTYAYTVSFSYMNDGHITATVLDGVYLTKQDAQNALAAWVLEEWENSWYMPWENRGAFRRDMSDFPRNFSTWVEEHTVEDVLTLWYTSDYGSYLLNKVFISRHAAPTGASRNAK